MTPLDPTVTKRLSYADAHAGAALVAVQRASEYTEDSAVMAERLKNPRVQEYAGLLLIAIDILRKADQLGRELTR